MLDDSARGAFGSTSPVNACVDVLLDQDAGSRRLRIFVDGKRVLSNDAIAMGPGEGGAMGDPFLPLAIEHGSLVVENYGGGGPLRASETWHLTIAARMAKSANRAGRDDTRQKLELRCEACEAATKQGLTRSVSTSV